jgi:hypothetical protein
MSEILVNTIKKADGTGSITVPADCGLTIEEIAATTVEELKALLPGEQP